MGIAGGPWRVETRVASSISFSIPSRRRAFWTDGGTSCALLGRRELAVLAILPEAVCPP